MQRDPDQDGQPPLLGSWRRLYLAALLSALLVMALIAVFSAVRW